LYERKYQIAHHDERFKLAQVIARKAGDIEVAKETRWASMLKEHLFGKLIRSVSKVEGMKVFNAKQIVERIRVCVPSKITLWQVAYLTNFPTERTKTFGNTAAQL
jgi:hypothetical protein